MLLSILLWSMARISEFYKLSTDRIPKKSLDFKVLTITYALLFMLMTCRGCIYSFKHEKM